MHKKKPRTHLKLVQTDADPVSKSIPSSSTDETDEFLALMKRLREQNRRSKPDREFDDDEAA